MEHQAYADTPELEQQKLNIETLCHAVKEFDPSAASISWSPDNGGEILSRLNKLSDVLAKKSAEIKQHVRGLTVEELNELDGFDR